MVKGDKMSLIKHSDIPYKKQSRLPYEFDLMWDIKTVEELYDILKGEPHCTDFDAWELVETMQKYYIPLPNDYDSPLKNGFPTIVWIDANGNYNDYAPMKEEEHKFQKMRKI
jgi:hypothetical protein